jgi:enoyl-CoA hydratase
MGLVEVATEGPIATLTLNRPEQRNALSIELCDRIVDSLAVIGGDDAARVIIVRGAGPTFCSGADLAAVSGAGGLDFLPAFERMLEAVAGFELPTIAAIHGAALGGGCSSRPCATSVSRRPMPV